jgi:acyl carrier protein
MDIVATQKKVREYVVENFLLGEDEDEFSDEMSFLESGLIDSTGILELVGFLEEEFEIEIADEEMIPDNLDSVESVARFVVLKREGPDTAATG